MSTLQIRLLGALRLTCDGEPIPSVNTPRLQSLLAYLVLHSDSPQLRQRLAFLYWPDSSEAQARNNLRQVVHGLRLALPCFDDFVQADANTLQWRAGASYSLDIAEFEAALALAEELGGPSDAEERRAALERAATLYTADLLPACYDDWIAPERERLRQRYLHALDQLIRQLEAARDYRGAIDYARRLMRHDPLDEAACRRLMRLLEQVGERAGAMRVYHACATALQRELGIAPSAETLAAYERLLRRTGAPASAPALERHPPFAIAPSLVGREREWGRLRDVWSGVCAGASSFTLISGEAGIGKTRLAEDFARWSYQQGATIAKARCYDLRGRLSLAPVTEWLRSEGIKSQLGRLDPVWLVEVARVAPELLSERPDLPQVEPIGEYGQRQRFFEALARAIVAAQKPLLLLIDDLHWCDEETLEWLGFLLRYAPHAQMLVVGTARREELHDQHPLRGFLRSVGQLTDITEMQLQPLDAAESTRLASMIAGRSLDVSTAMWLFRETEGNPLFVVETMRAGLEKIPAGGDRNEGDGAQRSLTVAPALPPRVYAVIADRLARLSPGARELAALAATIGRAFRLDVVAHAGGVDEGVAVRALDELWQRRIVREQGINTYDFTHGKLREVAYAELSAPQRRLLHRRIAQALEAVYDANLGGVSGQLAAHYERAGLFERAIAYYRRAATVAKSVYANEDAIGLLTRAVELLDHLPRTDHRDTLELELLLALAPIYRVTRGWTAPELERVIERTLTLCDTVGDDVQRADALYSYQSLLTVQARLREAIQVTDELKTVYRRINREPPVLSGMMLAGANFHLGEFVMSADQCERIYASTAGAQTDVSLDAQGWSLAAHTRAWHSHMVWCLGYPDRALRLGVEAVRLARDLELPFNQALTTTYLAMLQQWRADAATAKSQAEEALTLTSEYKAPYYRVWASILAIYGEVCEAPVPSGVARLHEAIDTFKSSGARLRLPYYLWLQARLCRALGRLDEGLALVSEALDQSRASGECWWDSELHRLRSALLLASDTTAQDAEAALLEALSLARVRQAKSLELRAATSLAQLWRAQGHILEARSLLGGVYDWFVEGFDTRDLRTARSLLDELS
ncbi:MAG TPA: AAA family ATPase [Ktedonobacterales bacterium]